MTRIRMPFCGPVWLITRYDDVRAVLSDPWLANDRRTIDGGQRRAVEALIPHMFKLLQESTVMSDAPGADLVTALLAAESDGDRLVVDELLSMIFLLLLAGHETTVNLIGSGVLPLRLTE